MISACSLFYCKSHFFFYSLVALCLVAHAKLTYVSCKTELSYLILLFHLVKTFYKDSYTAQTLFRAVLYHKSTNIPIDI